MSSRALALTPASSALVLIDHQVGIMNLITTIPVEVVKRMTIALAKVAKILNMPVFLTSSQESAFQGRLLPELEKLLPDSYAARVRRNGIVNAWDDARFSEAIAASGRCNLIMAGITTDVCLVYAAISAFNSGYQVHAVMDASGSLYELSEEMARRRMERAGVVLTATNTLIAELARDWSTVEGQKLITILTDDVVLPVKTA